MYSKTHDTRYTVMASIQSCLLSIGSIYQIKLLFYVGNNSIQIGSVLHISCRCIKVTQYWHPKQQATMDKLSSSAHNHHSNLVLVPVIQHIWFTWKRTDSSMCAFISTFTIS